LKSLLVRQSQSAKRSYRAASFDKQGFIVPSVPRWCDWACVRLRCLTIENLLVLAKEVVFMGIQSPEGHKGV
jgi:hypothetical protein